MSVRNSVLIGSGIVILLATSSLALYYWNQAACYEQEWKDAMAQIGTMSSPGAAPSVWVNLNAKTAARNMKTNSDVSTRTEVRSQPESQSPGRENVAGAVRTGNQGSANQERRRGMDWLDNIKTNNPQRYEEIQQRRKDMQQHAETAWSEATDYFLNRDTSNMTDQDIDQYNRMMTLLEQTRALTQQLQADLTQDERRDLMTTVRSNIVELTPLLSDERDKEYYDLAVTMGQSSSEASSLVNYVDQITSNTSVRTIFPNLRGGGGPGFVPPNTSPLQLQR